MSELKRYDQLGPICIIETPDGRWVDPDEAEAVLKEKDAEIVALKKRVQELEEKPAKKTCDGCVHFEKRVVEWPCNDCARCADDKWEARG